MTMDEQHATSMFEQMVKMVPPQGLHRIGTMGKLGLQAILAYAGHDAGAVLDIHEQIAGYDEEHPGAIISSAPFSFPIRTVAAKQELFLDIARRNHLKMSIGAAYEGGAGLVWHYGPPALRDQTLAEMRIFARGQLPRNPPAGQEAAALAPSFHSLTAATAWIFKQVFPAPALGRELLHREMRSYDNTMAGNPDDGHDILDEQAWALIQHTLTGWRDELLPPREPGDRNLLELEIVGVAQIYLAELGDAAPDLDMFRAQLETHIANFTLPAERVDPKAPRSQHTPSSSAYSAPKPGARPAGSKKRGKR